mmetsp:Transcript_120557/g.336369  ORF Transcript_120557/g.336369 Transcript_120557/m.336369 type:complete len:505 (-) Transcript_120557:32-1546(-)
MAAQRVAISMPALSGHVNPALGVARQLVASGCSVDFMCTSHSLRAAIEGTGALFHLAADWQPELYEGRHSEPPLGTTGAVMAEQGVVVQGTHAGAAFVARMKVANVMLEMQLPGTVRFLEHVKPSVVVYDAMVGGTRDAYYAAKLLGIPLVSILTVAGPGGNAAHLVHGSSAEAFRAAVLDFTPNLAATKRLNVRYPGLHVPTLPEPVGMLESAGSAMLVTTSEKLSEPMHADLAAAYAAQGTAIHYLGPFLDSEGAVRAGAAADRAAEGVVAEVIAARVAGRKVALVSMGTVLTSDVAHGWNGRPQGPQGEPRGLTGRELCQAAWGGAFDALGSDGAERGPLLLLALGSRPGALGELVPPPNALVCKSLPQVDILRAGVDAFLTHGGQNSFTEAMASGTPILVCPGFGDQVINSHKAERLGVGLKVDRADCVEGEERATAAIYRSDVAAALRQLLDNPGYRAAARAVAEDLAEAGGVEAAAKIVLQCARAPACPNTAFRISGA